MTTIDTITDEQIESLRAESGEAGDSDMVEICDVALGLRGDGLSREVVGALVRGARLECVRVIRSAEAQVDVDGQAEDAAEYAEETYWQQADAE